MVVFCCFTVGRWIKQRLVSFQKFSWGFTEGEKVKINMFWAFSKFHFGAKMLGGGDPWWLSNSLNEEQMEWELTYDDWQLKDWNDEEAVEWDFLSWAADFLLFLWWGEQDNWIRDQELGWFFVSNNESFTPADPNIGMMISDMVSAIHTIVISIHTFIFLLGSSIGTGTG